MAVRIEYLHSPPFAPDEPAAIEQLDEFGFVASFVRTPKGARLSWLPTAIVAAVLIFLALPLAGIPFGYRLFVVTGGSMAPEAEPGDAIVLERGEAIEVRAGDLITYRPLHSGAVTTHRVLSLHQVRRRLHFRTQGDANRRPDPDLVPASNVIGRATARIPHAGTAYAFATTGRGRMILVVGPAVVLIAGEVLRLRRRPAGRHRSTVVALRRSGSRRRRVTTVAAAALLALSVAGPAAGVFSETVSVGSNTFTTGQVAPPTLDSATADLLLCTITLNWTAPGTGFAPDGYDVYRSTTSGGPHSFVKHVGIVTSTQNTGLSANTTYFYVLRSTLQNWRSLNSNERSAKTALLCV